MKEEILNLASQTMSVSTKAELQHYNVITEINAYYFWNPVRGGVSVIINEDCERLGVTSTVNFDKHLGEFVLGK